MLDGLSGFQLYRHGDTILRATLRGGISLKVCELSSDDTWVPCYPNPITTTIHATRFQLASVGDRLAAVIRTDGPDTNLGVWILDDGAWTRLSTSLGTNHAPSLNDVVTHEGSLYVGYQATGALQVDRVDAQTGAVTPLGTVSDTPAGTLTDGLALGVAADGTLYAAWAETDEIDILHLARWTGEAWEPMDPPEDPRAGEPIDSVRLEVDPHGNPIVVYGGGPTGGLVRTARYNGY
jgi:hypothetical protein